VINRIVQAALLVVTLLATTSFAAVTTESGLISALNAVARAEPNVPAAEIPNRSSPIQIDGTITLTKPLRVPGNAHLIGTGNGAMLKWAGAEPPIVFYSAIGNGYSADVLFDGVSVWAPNASAIYDWDKSKHAGNASTYTFKNARWTCSGTHFNCRAPGDGRFYWPVFDNITCFGSGNLVRGTPVGGWFIRCFYVNNHCSDYVIELEATPNGYGGDSHFINCWINPGPDKDGRASGIFRSVGAFGLVDWSSYSEPTGWFDKPMWVQDGMRNTVDTASVHFAGPKIYCMLRNGAILKFRGSNPEASSPEGWHVDLNVPMDKPLLDWSIDVLRRTFVFEGANSYVGFGGGKINAAGVTSATTRPATEEQPQK
jgi:hypothetical protein